VSSDNVAAIAPNFVIRHASDRALVSQVRIHTPPVIETKMGANFLKWPRCGRRTTTLSERNERQDHFKYTTERIATSLNAGLGRNHQNADALSTRQGVSQHAGAHDEPLKQSAGFITFRRWLVKQGGVDNDAQVDVEIRTDLVISVNIARAPLGRFVTVNVISRAW
jgi:hypothetical protein